MTDRELKRLNRTELLELLLKQTQDNERLQAEVNRLQQKLENRTIQLEQAGSIAEAALRLNGVFEAAEAAASQYLENVRRLAEEQAHEAE